MTQYKGNIWIDKIYKVKFVLFNDASGAHWFYIIGYWTSNIWSFWHMSLEETRCRLFMGYSFRKAARDLLYAFSHRQDNTYHGLWYTSRGALVGTEKSPIDGFTEEVRSCDRGTSSERSTDWARSPPLYASMYTTSDSKVLGYIPLLGAWN